MNSLRRLPVSATDVLACGLIVAAQVEAWTSNDVSNRPAAALFGLLLSVPFLFRKRFPTLVPLLVFATIAVQSYVDWRDGPITVHFFALLFAFWSAGAYNVNRPRAYACVGAGYAALALGVLNDSDGAPSDFVFIGLFLTLAFLAGSALLSRSQQAAHLAERAAVLERRRREEARLAVAEERARIARELHDVVAHSVSTMTIQASGVRRLLRPEQEREREALEVVERTGREALAEMRRLLGVLREADERPELTPQPGLGALDALLDEIRASGLDVDLKFEGDPRPLAPGVDLSAYRIVQDALRAALARDGDVTHADVCVRYAPESVEVEVTNDGRRARRSDRTPLHAIRERVAVCGGTFAAGPRPGGGFAVRATLPVESAAP